MSSHPSSNLVTEEEVWWAPLKNKVFAMLWLAWMTSNICMWMNDVAASWMMTSLSSSATQIALIQTMSNLPVFLLGLPSGAFADILNRKKYFMVTQLWIALNAAVLCFMTFTNSLNAPLLLFLTFTNGIGLAMRWPVFAAIVPDLVVREQLPAALALNGVAMNASRIIGPLIAGALIASAGTEYVFALNMILSLACTVLIWRWKYTSNVSPLPGERFLGAIRVGIQYVKSSMRMRAVLLRVFIFFVQSSALMALLPVIAKDHFNGDAKTFTLLLSCLGFGAIVAASQLPRIRHRYDRNQLVPIAQILQAITAIGVVLAPSLWLAAIMMMFSGGFWILTANSLSIAAQLTLPSWIRARGMSIFQMSLMGGSAIGAAIWGKLTTHTSVTVSVICGSVFGIIAVLLTKHLKLEGGSEEDMTPVCPIEHPTPDRNIALDAGPVMISLEYKINPQNIHEFKEVMIRSRDARLRQGAMSWSLFEDAEKEGMMVENFVFETWADYLRRFDRFTTNDLNLQEERFKFHEGVKTPKIIRRIASTLLEKN
jgi:MFS family permease